MMPAASQILMLAGRPISQYPIQHLRQRTGMGLAFDPHADLAQLKQGNAMGIGDGISWSRRHQCAL